MKRISKMLSLLLVFAMIVPGIAQAANLENAESIDRIADSNRWGTAVAISKDAKGLALKSSDVVILVNGEKGKYADALAASSLAAALEAPVLLTKTNELPKVTLAEIERLGAKEVIILGGELSVSKEIQNELENDYDVKRLDGLNRYETAAKVAKKVINERKADTAVIALGNKTNFADALGAGPLAGGNGYPVLFANAPETLAAETKAALTDLNIKNLIVLGGNAVISEKLETELKEDFASVKRIGGANRYETSLNIAKELGEFNTVLFAHSHEYADALAGAPLAAKLNAPLVLVHKGEALRDNVKDFIQANYDKDFRILGGIASVNQEIEQGIIKLVKEAAEESELKVVSVSAINGTTLKVTGTGLDNLKAEDVTLKNNEVESISASKDGKSATIKFKHSFTPDEEYTVTFAQENGDNALTFTFSIGEVDSVSLDVRTYDDDTANQTLTFKVNGESATADTEWLRQAGYSVNFVAVDEDNAAANIFAGGTSTSTKGLLANEVPVGKYTVEIQIVKDGKVVVSDKKVITVADLESTTTAINSIQLTNGTGFIHNSNTLVTGETADITRIVGNAAGKKNVVLPVGLAEVTSSNPAVVSVDSNELTANVAGKATITVKVGEVTHTLDITVAKAERAVAKVTPTENTVKLVQGVTRTIDVNAVDQYGDPIAVTAADIDEDIPKDAAGTDLVSILNHESTQSAELVTGINGKTTAGLDIIASGSTTGNGTLIFKDENGKNIGQVGVQVTDVDNVDSTKVEYTVASDKTTNSIGMGDVNEYQVSKFNKNGFYNGAETLNTSASANELTVESADIGVATVSISSGSEAFTVNPVAPGKTDITIKDENGLVVHKFTVEISASPIVITKVNFKSVSAIDYVGKTVDVSDVLDVRPDSSNDRIVYGVEHNADTIAKVRIADGTLPSGTAVGAADELILYIDMDNSGEFDAGDIELGAVTAEVLSGATGTNLGTLATNNINIAVGNGSYTTASTDNGNILFRVIIKDASGNYPVNNAIATSVVNVKVK